MQMRYANTCIANAYNESCLQFRRANYWYLSHESSTIDLLGPLDLLSACVCAILLGHVVDVESHRGLM